MMRNQGNNNFITASFANNIMEGDWDDGGDDWDHHSVPHLNSFSGHHGVSIRPFAAEDCFMKLFAIKRALMLMAFVEMMIFSIVQGV